MVNYWYQDRVRDEASYTLFLGSSSIARLPANMVTACKPTVIYGFENGVAEDILMYLKFAELEKASRVIVYIGENDIAQGEQPLVTLSQVNRIITELLTLQHLEISIMTVKPSPRRVRHHLDFTKFNQALKEDWSQLEESNSNTKRVSFIPFHNISNVIYYSRDGVHLNNAGYNVLSEMINATCINT